MNYNDISLVYTFTLLHIEICLVNINSRVHLISLLDIYLMTILFSFKKRA